MKPKLSLFFIAPLAFSLAQSVSSHPIPDVPVRSSFERDGTAKIQVEIEPRCFGEDPHTAPYVFRKEFEEFTEVEREQLLEQAREFLKKTAEFEWQPGGVFSPGFEFDFEIKPGEPLGEADDVVAIMAEAALSVSEGTKAYRIRALPDGVLSVLFLNELGGQTVERVNVLFPGEDSFWLDLSGLAELPPAPETEETVGVEASVGDRWATLFDFVHEGFRHVLPLGLDHILFVLGLFLLSREWRPLLYQVTTFTVAHTLTLGMATLGLVSISSAIVEPIIAGSIAVVALENIFRPRYSHWRLLVVFVFGLVHGLGFAGALSALDLPPAALVIGLLGFNVGVELGQLAVIGVAFIVTMWLRKPEDYRKYVVIPGSVAIAAMGVWWVVERTLL